MSKLTLCSYCLLKVIRKSAKAKKKEVTIVADTAWGMGGLNVYVHPPSVVISKLEGGEDGERAVYHAARVKKIEDHCSC